MTRRALVIGINEYRDASIRALQFAANDAFRMARLLRQVCGFQEVVELFTSTATRTNVLQEVTRLVDVSTDGDQLLVYFAGHGHEHKTGGHMLLTYEAVRHYLDADVQEGSLLVSSLDKLTALKRLTRILIVDACRDVLEAAAVRSAAGPRGEALARALGHAHAEAVKAGAPPLVSIAACDTAEQSYELPGRRAGAFTEAWVSVLERRCARGAGFVLPDDVTEVARECALLVSEQYPGHQQTPTCRFTERVDLLSATAQRSGPADTAAAEPVTRRTTCPACDKRFEFECAGNVACPKCAWAFEVDAAGEVTAGQPIEVDCPACQRVFPVRDAGSVWCPKCNWACEVGGDGAVLAGMPIDLTCPACVRPIRLLDVGHQVCPRCTAQIVVDSDDPTVATVAPPADVEEVEEAGIRAIGIALGDTGCHYRFLRPNGRGVIGTSLLGQNDRERLDHVYESLDRERLIAGDPSVVVAARPGYDPWSSEARRALVDSRFRIERILRCSVASALGFARRHPAPTDEVRVLVIASGAACTEMAVAVWANGCMEVVGGRVVPHADAPSWDTVKPALADLISDAEVDPHPLVAVVLVGTQDWPEAVRAELHAGLLQRGCPEPVEDAGTVAVDGAEMMAAILAGTVKDFLLLNATPAEVAVRTRSGLHTLINCDTTIPTRKSDILPVRELADVSRIEWCAGGRVVEEQFLPQGIQAVEVTADVDADYSLGFRWRAVELEEAPTVHTRPSTDPPRNPQPGDRWTSPRDGQAMVWVPPGEFLMGSPEDAGHADERPQHRVQIAQGFWLDVTPVTNEAYARFVAANPEWAKGGPAAKAGADSDYLKSWTQSEPPSHERDHPVTWVNWHAARAYAAWAGKRLPSEAEWEYATRAGTRTKYWWGDAFDRRRAANGFGTEAVGGRDRVNPWGLADMLGNVWEWTSSKPEGYPYYLRDGREDVDDDGGRVVRGGSSYFGAALRCTYRFRRLPRHCSNLGGFRCAQSGS